MNATTRLSKSFLSKSFLSKSLTIAGAMFLTALISQQTSLASPRFASFGDNIADPGNIPAILQSANDNGLGPFDTNFPVDPPNFGNRFTNGLTAAEVLPDLLGFNGDNISHNAVGNAFSDKLPVSLAGDILLGNGSSIPAPIGRELTPLNDTDVATQVDNYLITNGSLGPDDLMLLYASANDGALALNTVAIAMPEPEQALQVIDSGARTNAANTAQSAEKLLDAGAGAVVVVGLPDIGLTPAAQAGGLSGQQLATLFSNTTNTALVTELNALDTGDSLLVMVDSFTLTNDIVNNPEKYGLTDVSTPCSLAPECASANVDVQDQFLFWDSFFPTAGVHRITAQFQADTVLAPRTLAALPETARLSVESISRERLKSLASQATADRWLKIRLGASSLERNRDSQVIAYEADTTQAEIAAGANINKRIKTELSVGFEQSDIAYKGLSAGFDMDSVQVSATGRMQTELLNLTATFVYASNSFDDMQRWTGVAGQVARASTDGNSLASTVEISRDIVVGDSIETEPFIRLGLSDINIDGYTESGATGLDMQVNDINVDNSFGEAGLRVGSTLPSGQWTLDAEASYHLNLGDDQKRISSSLVTLADFERLAVSEAPDNGFLELSGIASYKPTSNVGLSLQAGYLKGDEIDSWSVTGGLNISF